MLSGRTVAGKALEELGLPAEVITRLFAGVPVDFPILFVPHLPLYADRFGMTGITLRRRVYLLESSRHLPPARLLALLRHEAEHVQQQERSLIFYFRYAWEWLLGFVTGLAGGRTRSIGERSHDAYRNISAERDAYRAEAEARRWLQLLVAQREQQPGDHFLK